MKRKSSNGLVVLSSFAHRGITSTVPLFSFSFFLSDLQIWLNYLLKSLPLFFLWTKLMFLHSRTSLIAWADPDNYKERKMKWLLFFFYFFFKFCTFLIGTLCPSLLCQVQCKVCEYWTFVQSWFIIVLLCPSSEE